MTLRNKMPNASRRLGRSVFVRPLHGAPDVRLKRGVALVVTLILLAVITTLAVAFLALTSRETGAVDAMGRTTDAELAAESALERARAQIVAPFPFFNQGNNFGSEIMGPDFTVSIAWETNRLASLDLFRDPSPPVFVDTNRVGTTGPGEDRFYLDLNRNSLFEQTGHVPVTTDNPANNGWGFQFEVGPNGLPLTNWLVGDPQWIGVLQDPSRPHGPDNRFIARYAFVIQPIGRSLDVNWMHNQALDGAPADLDIRPGGFNGYFRNQGVGTWEINMGGFLADLNANYWNSTTFGLYGFDPLNIGPQGAALTTSAAFTDAREFLRYRNSPPVWDLASPAGFANRMNDTLESLVPGGGAVFASDSIDGYSDGPFSFGPVAEAAGDPLPADNATRPWPGASSRRRFSSIHDFFDGTKLTDPLGFTNKLKRASARGNSYDRYTYYRMLAQLGTDSEGEQEDAGKINVNYVNVGGIKPSELIPWSNINIVSNATGRPGPELFLVSVATNMFRRDPALAFLVTNEFYPGTTVAKPVEVPFAIPVFTNGSPVTTNLPFQGVNNPGPLYAARIHQILQLAANIHDATTGSKGGEQYPYFSSVFRPQFTEVLGPGGRANVYITNYVMAGNANATNNLRWLDLQLGDRVRGPNDAVYGIPYVIGARQGMPNFNELAIHTEARVVRRLFIRRDATTRELVETNQQWELTITNYFAAEVRNGYSNTYPRQLRVSLSVRPTVLITNSATSAPLTLPAPVPITGALQFNPGTWSKANEYQVPLLSQSNQFVLRWITNTPPERGGFTNQWAMVMTNHFLFYLIDGSSNQIVDAVSLNGPRTHFKIGEELIKLTGGSKPKVREVWDSGVGPRGTSKGVENQIFISSTLNYAESSDWANYSDQAQSRDGGVQGFVDWLSDRNNTNLIKQVPFTPVRVMVHTNFLEVNDPLVHFTEEDLYPTSGASTVRRGEGAPAFVPAKNPKSVAWNDGQTASATDAAGTRSVDPRLRDPGLTVPDRWDFPTNTLANVGWLGRVHRGTPWQSIYLKSDAPSLSSWKTHSGTSRADGSASSIQPTRDWGLFDVFTTAFHPNAVRGRLSVNQTNLAAWSAVLSGIIVGRSTNEANIVLCTNEVVNPASVDAAVLRVVEGINRARTNTATGGKSSGQFSRMGDVLAAPELTMLSPFLNAQFDGLKPTGIRQKVYDADYERIPQQILSLLKLGEPRFVVYVWGQSLKPARYGVQADGTLSGPSIVTTGDDKGLCINYQITGEAATKSIIRVDFDRLDNGRLDYTRPHAVVERFNIVPND